MGKARKVLKYVVEPKSGDMSQKWESFHATNPSSMRIDGCENVFLAYRAGGDNDRYCLFDKFVWASSMGLCVLDKRGEEVLYRFPLPIIKNSRKVAFPQNKEEFDEYQKTNEKTVAVLHDFRFFTLDGFVYVLMHEGALTFCYDTIVKIPQTEFLHKIEESKKLIDEGNVNCGKLDGGDANCGNVNDGKANSCKVNESAWAEIWWKEGVWQNAGNNGSNRFWASVVNKTDIVVIKLDNGKIQINHRTVPDYAALTTGGECYSCATADGFTKLGVLENCVRPGYYDNSHVGNNGNPIRMKVRGEDVYMDIVHGVNNASITNESMNSWDMTYVPYLRLKSAYDGEVIYYSKEPILTLDETWKEYVEEGSWVSKLEHLRGVMFPGGQVAKDAAKITENDEFTFYTGVGDTAVARADFRLCELMTDKELCDIGNHSKNRANSQKLNLPQNAFKLKNVIKGWDYKVINERGTITLLRELTVGICKGETAKRDIGKVAGYFDFAGQAFDGKSVFYTEYGTIIVYKGFNFSYSQNINTKVGYGVLVLSNEHPEKILYRSEQSVTKPQEYCGLNIGEEFKEFCLSEVLNFIPDKVKSELKVMYQMIESGKTFASDHAKWLKERGNAY